MCVLLLGRLGRIDVLVIDDWATAPLWEPERRGFQKIRGDRYQVRSLIGTTQLPVTRWHEQIGNPTVADGIADRLVHNARRIEMRCDPTRKNRGKPNTLTKKRVSPSGPLGSSLRVSKGFFMARIVGVLRPVREIRLSFRVNRMRRFVNNT
jgi:hypothetical protein